MVVDCVMVGECGAVCCVRVECVRSNGCFGLWYRAMISQVVGLVLGAGGSTCVCLDVRP
jgi:hypothetical protein